MKFLKFLFFFGLPSLAFASGIYNPGAGGSGGDASGISYVRDGYSIRFNENVNVTTVAQALDNIFEFGYESPDITLTSSPAPEVVEDGTNIASVGLTAFTVETSSPIIQVTFYRNGSLIDQNTSPPSGGGNVTYTDNTAVTSTTTWTAEVTDGVSTTTSNSQTITYVYPFFYGVGAQALTMSQIAALTKLVQTKQDTTTTTSPTNQVYYFAYPASYGSLTKILDQNGFETISGYTQHTYSYTAADSTVQSYYAYEFNTLTTQTNFKNTYEF
jgi:hypothetical protein